MNGCDLHSYKNSTAYINTINHESLQPTEEKRTVLEAPPHHFLLLKPFTYRVGPTYLKLTQGG